MNPNKPSPPPDDFESKITALLLGELAPDEARAVEQAIAADAALTALRDRLRTILPIVRQAVVGPEASAESSANGPRLSAERRDSLLRHFKTIVPRGFDLPRSRWQSWLIPMSAAAVLIVMASLVLPSFGKAKSKGQSLAYRHDAPQVALVTRLGGEPAIEPADEPADVQSDDQSQIDPATGMPVRGESRGSTETRERLVQTVQTGPDSGREGVQVAAKAESSGAESARPMMDIRMLMRYGLLPKGMKIVEEAGELAPAFAPAEGAEGRKTDVASLGQRILARQQPQARTPVPSAPVQSELTPLPLELPAPAFVGTPTDLPVGGGAAGDKARKSEIGGGEESAQALAWADTTAKFAGIQQNWHFDAAAEGAPVNDFALAESGRMGGGGMGGMMGGMGGVGGAGASGGFGGFGGGVFGGGVQTDGDRSSTDSYFGRQVATDRAEDPATHLFSTIRAKAGESDSDSAGTTEVGQGLNRSDHAGVRITSRSTSAPDQKSLVAGANSLASLAMGGRPSRRAAAPTAAPTAAAAAAPVAAPALPAMPGLAAEVPPSGGVAGPASSSEAKANAERSAAGYYAYGLPAQKVAEVAKPPVLGDVPLLGAEFGALKAEPETLRRVASAADASAREPEPVGLFTPGDGKPIDSSVRRWAVASGEQRGRARVAEPSLVPTLQLADKEQVVDRGDGSEMDFWIAPTRQLAEKEKVADRLAESEKQVADLRLGVAVVNGKARGLQPQAPDVAASVAAAPPVAAPVVAAPPIAAAAVAAPDSGVRALGLMTNAAASLEALEANGRVAGDLVVQEVAKKAASQPSAPPPEPQPEVATAANPFSTFSLNVTDVSFKLAAASLEQGALPDASRIRSEEFLNAFDYRDPEPVRGAPVAFAWERARYPFAHNREAIRFSVQTAARGRSALRPLNLVLLLDSSGSMERADRVAIVREALSVLAQKLEAQDRISVVAFARTARLWVDGVPGSQAREVLDGVGRLTPEGGTNLEDALNVAYETAARHFVSHGVNRVVLLTDGAANLGDVDPESLKQKVETARKKGIALDCFGIGWEGYNDDLLEVLSSHGDGRYGFVNSPEEAATGLAEQLAGALEVAAADVKVQVEFNPHRARAWRQIGYAKHQLTKEQFRDNTVDAAELGAAESGNALYILELNPRGQGDVGTVRVRYREAASGLYREHAWRVPYTGPAPGLEESSPAMRLAVTSAAFAEWLASSPFAGEVTPDKLLGAMAGVTDAFGPDARPRQLESMIRAAKSISGQ
ncbi:MAG TPA: von Willebrand factor type A domain-containing protein [Verrucomicrobiota bacterium]|nr:von Willebrand factor type A domain-containing protein [Verrucomicrobiota bacterium]